MNVIAISACLMGTHCRYNGSSALNNELFELVKDRDVLLFCPEIMANLPTPRSPVEIAGGNGYDVINGQAMVVNKEGINMTGEFLNGAQRAMDLFMQNKVSAVVLKEKSPSCGVNEIYDGRFLGTLVKGCGVLTALLLQNGLKIFSNEDLHSLKQWLESQERVCTDE